MTTTTETPKKKRGGKLGTQRPTIRLLDAAAPRGLRIRVDKSVIVPNLRSRYSTPCSIEIDMHYVEQGIFQRWNWDRYTRLATFLKLTASELASLVGMQHSVLHYYRRKNFYPPGSACILLTLIEARVMKGYIPVIENPFPNLNALPSNP